MNRTLSLRPGAAQTVRPAIRPRPVARAKAAAEASHEHPDRLIKAALDTLAIPTAVLDGNGRIRLVNTCWRDLLHASGRRMQDDGVGAGYLGSGILGAMSRQDALALRTGLRKVLRRAAANLHCVVHVDRGEAEKWYRVRAARLTIGGLDKVVVTHEDVSAVHAARRTVEALSRRLLTLQDEERERIAVELHDSTAQQLTAAGLFLHSLRARHTIDAEMQRSVEQIERTLGEARKEIRTLSYLLNPPYLHRDGLRETLMRFVDGFARRTGLAATAQIPRKVDGFMPDVQQALLRIVQEALSNVHRHAAASRVTVRIKVRRTTVLFGILDDGRGIRSAVAGVDATSDQPSRSELPGLGVHGMHARMRHLGGALTIRGGRHGTIVFGRIPLVRCLRAGRAVAFDDTLSHHQ
jgi:signal transduction histidine kinase